MCESVQDSEVYGRGYADKEKIKKHYHYEVQHGEELSDVYNSFKYALLPSILVNSQRLSEVTACGCIPIVYDARNFMVEENSWDDHCLFFHSKNDIATIVNEHLEPVKNPSEIAEELSYTNLVKKMLHIMRERL